MSPTSCATGDGAPAAAERSRSTFELCSQSASPRRPCGSPSMSVFLSDTGRAPSAVRLAGPGSTDSAVRAAEQGSVVVVPPPPPVGGGFAVEEPVPPEPPHAANPSERAAAKIAKEMCLRIVVVGRQGTGCSNGTLGFHAQGGSAG